jgi:hypothetical protein
MKVRRSAAIQLLLSAVASVEASSGTWGPIPTNDASYLAESVYVSNANVIAKKHYPQDMRATNDFPFPPCATRRDGVDASHAEAGEVRVSFDRVVDRARVEKTRANPFLMRAIEVVMGKKGETRRHELIEYEAWGTYFTEGNIHVPTPTNDLSFLPRGAYVSNAFVAAWARYPDIMRWPTNKFCAASPEPHVRMVDLSNAAATVHITIERGGPTHGNQATPTFHTMQTVSVEMDKAGRVLVVKRGPFYDDLVAPDEVRR